VPATLVAGTGMPSSTRDGRPSSPLGMQRRHDPLGTQRTHDPLGTHA